MNKQIDPLTGVDKNKALATLCIGGGQGAAFLLEI